MTLDSSALHQVRSVFWSFCASPTRRRSENHILVYFFRFPPRAVWVYSPLVSRENIRARSVLGLRFPGVVVAVVVPGPWVGVRLRSRSI